MPKIRGQGWCENISCSNYGQIEQIEVSLSDKKEGDTFGVKCPDCGCELTGWVLDE